jgi:SAM-dependent methyltransferase
MTGRYGHLSAAAVNPRIYQELSAWWPLFSRAGALRRRSRRSSASSRAVCRLSGTKTLLELGSGGGSFASHLKNQFKLTLTDLSEGMLAQSRAVNPGTEHIQGDMRTLRLGASSNYVLVHDAVCYMTTLDDLQKAIDTAAVHCKGGGTVIVLPDFVTETFTPGTDDGGEDAPDGRASVTSNGNGIPIPATPLTSSTMRFCFERRMETCARSTTVTSKACSPRHVAERISTLPDCEPPSGLDEVGRDVFLAKKP